MISMKNVIQFNLAMALCALVAFPALSDNCPDLSNVPGCPEDSNNVPQPPDCAQIEDSYMCVIWQPPEDHEPECINYGSSDCSLTGIQRTVALVHSCNFGIPTNNQFYCDEPCDLPPGATDGDVCGDYECYDKCDQTNNDECTESAPQYRICLGTGTCSNGECTDRSVTKTQIEDCEYGDTDGKTCYEWCNGKFITSACVKGECPCTLPD